ncbi:MAG TPA: patatin-like phospholipase family protein [Paracoccaceae bacterium]|nr:patatin-like phospholipase family protein [Paracoccaceae bacterium]
MARAAKRAEVGLVLSGGGARGAYQVGVLKAAAEICGPRNPFGIVTGISVGAINTLALVSRPRDFQGAVARLEELWRGLHCSSIFRTDMQAVMARLAGWARYVAFGRLGVPPPDSLLDNAPLREFLEREVDFAAMREAIAAGLLRAVAVTASSYRTGQAVTFYESGGRVPHWSRKRREGREEALTIDHVMASTALPFVFPAQRLGAIYYGDGALRQTSPLSPAIHLGARRLFVIAGRDGQIDAPPPEDSEPDYPSTGVIGGHLLDILFNDHLDTDLERLERINATLARMSPAERRAVPLKPTGVVTVRPSQDIREITARHVRAMPVTVRMLVRAVGAWRPPYVLPSYLMFEPDYVGELIDLGYRDAMAQAGQIRGFLAAAELEAGPASERVGD